MSRSSAVLDAGIKPELFPILRHAQFEDLLNHTFADPVSSLLRAVRPDDSLHCRVEIRAAPASRRRCRAAGEAVKLLDRSFFRTHHHLAACFARHVLRGRWRPVAWLLGRIAARSQSPGHSLLETSTSRLHEREEDLQAAADKIGGHLFECRMRLVVQGPPERRMEAVERLRSMAGALGAFTRSRLAMFRGGGIRRGDCVRHTSRAFLLSHEELATLWHPPTATAAPERMLVSEFTELEPPAVIGPATQEGTVALGRVRFRDDQRLVTLALEDRRRHLYIVGKTGMGKTTLIQNMLAEDIAAGRGVCLVDPHGDLAESIAGLVPSHRTNDVILFDAASRDCVVGFNPLASLGLGITAEMGVQIPLTLIDDCVRLCCSLCLLENDPSVIEPDVLSKDRDRFEASGDDRYVDKAHRRGKIGWNVGRRIEVAPHYGWPHMALVWTGRGRAVPKVVPRRGSVVHREMVEKVPSGFGE